LSMRRIKQLALSVVGRSGDPEFSQTERSMLFLDAWAIVDRAHNIGTLLKCGGPSITVGADINFAPEASKAKLMRNAMDHVAQQMGNIVKKNRAPPLYGIVTFAWEEKAGEISIVNVSGSGFHHAYGWNFMKSMHPMTGEACDHFILHAFDIDLSLSRLADLTATLREAFSRAAEEQCRKAARENATPSGGRTFEELMAPVTGATTLTVRRTREEG
jgi:hypothetical protein